jgi:hypothetical protein
MWKLTVPITKRYLLGHGEPVTRVDVIYQYPPTHQSHAAEEINLPVHSALAIGAVVMLLCNIVTEECLMNRLVGIVKKIVYASREGSRGANGPREHPAYVIVHFPDCMIPEVEKFIDDMPQTCVLVAPVTLCCEKGCCSAITIPLRVCKAITGHKSQGQSIGDKHAWSKVVVCLLCKKNKTPRLEQVSVSRATSLSVLAFNDTHEDLTHKQLMLIGKGQAYNKREQFEERMHDSADQTQADFHQQIINMDTNQESPSFNRCFNAVVQLLYRCHLSSQNRTS